MIEGTRKALLAVAAAGCLILGPRALAKDGPKAADRRLQARIDHAIQRGSAWLQKNQLADGEFAAQRHGKYTMGMEQTSLCLLALLHSGVPPTSSTVQRALTYLRSVERPVLTGRYAGAHNPLLQVYSVSTTIMVLCDLARRKLLSEVDRQWLLDLCRWLQKVEISGGWGYPGPGGWVDNSNSQYAMLALHAAKRAGAPVSAKAFLEPLERLLRTQESRGPKVPRYREVGGDGVYAASLVRARGDDHARGWGYRGRGGATGSMTSAGVASVAIAIDALGPAIGSYKAQAEQSVRDGLAWLSENFTVHYGGFFPFYYLYGLERAGVLAHVVYMGKHRWYAEGARYLVGGQAANGRFRVDAQGARIVRQVSKTVGQSFALVRQSFALLFLSRATVAIEAPITEASHLDLDGACKLSDKDLKDVFLAAFRELGKLRGGKVEKMARNFAKLGPRVLPLLLTRLLDGNSAVRSRAVMVLREMTGLNFDYDADAPAGRREDAADRWTAWYLSHKADLGDEHAPLNVR